MLFRVAIMIIISKYLFIHSADSFSLIYVYAHQCNKLVKMKNGKKLLCDANYMFLDTGLTESKPERGDDTANKTNSSIDKDIVKMRSIEK
jgi:hypothetical protein